MPRTILEELRASVFPKALTISDAKKDLTIEITAHDCELGKRKNHRGCAAARSVKRILKLDSVAVGRSTLYCNKAGHLTRYIIPQSLQKEIVAFDRGAPFAPGIYVIKKPWGNNRRVAQAKQKPHPTKNPGTRGKKAKIRHFTTGIRAIL
jgi:hypothetical protein